MNRTFHTLSGFRSVVASVVVLLFAGAHAETNKPATSTSAFEAARSLPPARSDLILGRFVYSQNCQICHGSRGDGKGEWSEGLLPRPRSFRAAHFKYRSTPSGKLPTDADLVRTIRGGRSNTAMGMFTRLNDRELRAVISYLKSFSSKWKNADFHGEKVILPPKPQALENPEHREAFEKRGRALFIVSCAPCHGENADGEGPQASSLMDVHERPIKPADLLVPHLRSGSKANDILRVLMTGLDGTPMASFADSLSAVEMWEVVAYVEALRRDSSH